MGTPCTCGISRTPCNSAFVIAKDTGKAVAECVISISVTDLREPEKYIMLCAGKALQNLNQNLKNGVERHDQL